MNTKQCAFVAALCTMLTILLPAQAMACKARDSHVQCTIKRSGKNYASDLIEIENPCPLMSNETQRNSCYTETGKAAQEAAKMQACTLACTKSKPSAGKDAVVSEDCVIKCMDELSCEFKYTNPCNNWLQTIYDVEPRTSSRKK